MGRKKSSTPSTVSVGGSSSSSINMNPRVVLRDIVKEEILSDDDDMDTRSTVSRRSSGRAPKPIKKSVRDVDNSGSEEEEDGDSSDSDVAPSRGKKKTAPRGRKPKSAPAKRGPASRKRQLDYEETTKKGGSKSKKSKKGSEDDDSGESDEEQGSQDNSEGEDTEDGSSAQKAKNGSQKKTASNSNNGSQEKEKEEEDDLDNMNFHLEDEETDDDDWEKPNYKEKGWLKKNCLICQVCNTTYAETGEALKCFHKHKDKLRCYMCFYIIKGGKSGTKRLFRHYEKRHDQAEKKYTMKCVHCDEVFPYRAMSCHIIATHFREALGIPQKNAAGKGGLINGKQAVKASKAKDNEDLSDVEEESGDDDEKEPEDKEKDDNGTETGTGGEEEEEEGGDDGEDEEEEGEEGGSDDNQSD